MTAYVVDVDALEATVGSRDVALLEAILQTRPNGFWDYVDEDGCLSGRAALSAVINGEPFEEQHEQQYFEALEAICAHLGKEIGGMTFHGGWLPQVDAAFELLGMNLSMVELTIAWYDTIPQSDGNAGGGYWRRQACTAALDQWALTDPAERAALGRSMLEEIEMYVDWLLESKRHSLDIVTFC